MDLQKDYASESQETLLGEGVRATRYRGTSLQSLSPILKAWGLALTSLTLLAIILAFTSLVRGSSSSSSLHHDVLPNTTWLTCGKTVESAHEAGCRFDVMMSAWVPLPCYDEELMERTLAVEQWTWHLDA